MFVNLISIDIPLELSDLIDKVSKYQKRYSLHICGALSYAMSFCLAIAENYNLSINLLCQSSFLFGKSFGFTGITLVSLKIRCGSLTTHHVKSTAIQSSNSCEKHVSLEDNKWWFNSIKRPPSCPSMMSYQIDHQATLNFINAIKAIYNGDENGQRN